MTSKHKGSTFSSLLSVKNAATSAACSCASSGMLKKSPLNTVLEA